MKLAEEEEWRSPGSIFWQSTKIRAIFHSGLEGYRTEDEEVVI